MQSHRFVIILSALGLCGATACHRQSGDERVVGIWQFSGMDATMDYVFKADHTFELWAPSMDVDQSKGPWLQMDFGSWHIEKDELIIEYKRSRSRLFRALRTGPTNQAELISASGADSLDSPVSGPGHLRSLHGRVHQVIDQPNIMAWSSWARLWQCATYGPTKSRKPR